jgi:hypothetical protein
VALAGTSPTARGALHGDAFAMVSLLQGDRGWA